MPQRTFLALDLDDAALDHLEAVQRELRQADAGIRLVERENLHLTMIFLGDVPNEMLTAVCDLSAGAAAIVKPFEYDVRGVQCVPPSGQLRMVWAGIVDPTGRLAELAESLRTALDGQGLHEETRSFRPHITLARVRLGGPPGQSGRRADAIRQASRPHEEADFGVQYAEEVVVYGSRLTPQGPVYTPTFRARLGE